jgi:hypothetical protein
MAFDRTLVQVRERTFLGLLDLALVVVRNRPVELGVAALAGIAPFAALNARLISDPAFPPLAFAILVCLEIPWATAPLTIVLGSLMFGQRLGPGQTLRRWLKAVPSLVLFQLFLRVFLLSTVFLAALIPARLVFLNEVIVLEVVGWRKALRRSSQLCARRGGDLFLQWLAQVFFGAVFVLGFWFGTGVVLSALMTDEMTWERPLWSDFYGFRFQLALWLAIAFFAVARFLTYIDHRIRQEGWEIKLRLDAVALTMEEARAW